jgi:hypothetical protein
MNELATGADISIVNQGNMSIYNANKQAMDRIKSLNDEDFEKEVAKFDFGMQAFLRMARGR